MKSNLFLFLFLVLLLSSCGIMGIRFKVHNPKHAGIYPAFSEKTILLGELSPLRKNFDVSFYDLDINLDAINQTLSGWVAVRSVAMQDIDSIQLDLDEVFRIDSLSWEHRDGTPLRYSRKHRSVFIALPRQIKSGETFTVNIKYGGSPQKAKRAPWAGGVAWKKDKQKNDWIGVACEGDGASVWFPCKDHTSDEPDSARLQFTIPKSNLMAVSNGLYEGKTEQEGNTTFSWRVHNPINVYNLTFYVGYFAKIDDVYVGATGDSLYITHYVLQPNYERAKVHFKAVKDQIRIYESLYGPYAWYTDGFKLIESPYAGMEHQTAIAYGNKFKNDLQGVEDYIMVHEVGHEWFGNSVTATDFADVWLQEGLTTYGEALFLEKKYNRATSDKHMEFYRWMIKNKYPMVGPADRRYFNYKDGDVYVKGAWMMQSLRYTLDNDSLFFSVLKTFYQENARKLTDSKTFVATVNRLTGKNYNWFFNQYLYNNQVPFLEYQKDNDGNLYYRWTSVQDDFKGMPVTVILPSGKELKLIPCTQVQKVNVRLEKGDNPTIFSARETLFGWKKNSDLKKIYDSDSLR